MLAAQTDSTAFVTTKLTAKTIITQILFVLTFTHYLKFDFRRFFFCLCNLKIFRLSHTCACGKESPVEAFDVSIEVPDAVIISFTLHRNAILRAFQRIL